jgi:very-short-patch-repair endonuclease
MPTPPEIAAHAYAALDAAQRHRGVVSRGSAAAVHGWNLVRLPLRLEITVPRGSRLDAVDRRLVAVRRLNLPEDDLDGRVTSVVRTVLDCSRAMHFHDALVIADAALRSGLPPSELEVRAAAARGPGAVRLRRVTHRASRRAANLFESSLRAICHTITGLAVRPQVLVRTPDGNGRPDLVDDALRIVIEADSFEWHGKYDALVDDSRRYNAFIAAGWRVLRFTWVDVIENPASVRDVLVRTVAVAQADRGLSREWSGV